MVLTHAHSDHAGGARPLARRVGAVVAGPEGMEGLDLPLADGDIVETDAGRLVGVSTPGHARPHFAFVWPEARTLFAGDFFLGGSDTVWVGEYDGCVADYLASLDRIRTLDGFDTIRPAHGDPIDDPAAAYDRYEAHRRQRIDQVAAVLADHPESTVEEVLEAVYGTAIPEGVRGAARRSVAALVHHVRTSA